MIAAALFLKRWLSEKGLFMLGIMSSFFHKVYLSFVVTTVMLFLCKYHELSNYANNTCNIVTILRP